MNFNTCFNNYVNEINKYLKDTLSGKKGLIYEAMGYSLFAGGKRIRPVISLACCDALDGNHTLALTYAGAIEMIHTYSLIHDDLPCMDNDDLRRGKPTNHIVYGEDTAVLAGDALLNIACESIVSKNELPAEMSLKALKIIYSASGAEGMIGGQIMDMLAEREAPDAQTLNLLHSKKTGALIRAAASVGALSAGKDENMFDDYSSSLGLAFQIRDDILDIEGDAQKFGKPILSDEKNNKTTYVTLYGMDGAKKKLSEETEKAISSIEFLGEKGEFLRELALYLLNREI